MIRSQNNRGFTIIELLVVISIISLLSSIVLTAVQSAREKAKIAMAVRQLYELNNALQLYANDVGQYPARCMTGCTQNTDPLFTSTGPGWNGPYIRLFDMKHPWGGRVGFNFLNEDWDGDGVGDCLALYLDDDFANVTANDGMIPVDILTKIDNILDNGDLTTGNVRGNGGDWRNNGIIKRSSSAGELVIRKGCF